MGRQKLFQKYLNGLFITLFTIVLLLLTSACNQNESIVESTSGLSQNEALKRIAENDEVLQSFESNFNESDDMYFLAKTNTMVYPAKVWQKFDSRDFNLDLVEDGNTAYGVSTITLTGTLFIAASYNEFTPGEIGVVDTVIEKQFITVVTRNIVFEKVGDTGDQLKDWKIISISLPEGGTGSSNIFITKLTVTLPNGEILEVTSPNDYYISRNPNDRMGNRGNEGPGGPKGNNGQGGMGGQGGHGGNGGNGGQGGHGGMGGPNGGFNNSFMGQFPQLEPGVPVVISVELESAYSDTDYVAISFGADKFGKNRAKRNFELKSSVTNGATFSKVYEGTFEPRAMRGFFHAIVHAAPYHVIHDDNTAVEKVSWGVPYQVQ